MSGIIKRLFYRVGESIEEMILLSIIVLNILDFAELLNPDWDYVKKIISWTALGYLLYKADLTRIFFGEKHKGWDLAMIFAYFLISFKNMIGYSFSTLNQLVRKTATYWADVIPLSPNTPIPYDGDLVAITSPINSVDLNLLDKIPLGSGIEALVTNLTMKMGGVGGVFPSPNHLLLNVSNDMSWRLFQLEPKFLVHRWLNFITGSGVLESLQKVSIIAGASLLVIMAFYFTLRFDIKAPSLMHVIHEEGSPVPLKELARFLKRFAIILFVLNFFFVVVFNLMMEWLAIAIDAPLLVIGIFFYLLVWIKHHKRFSTEGLIYKLGNLGSGFYNRFINLFYDYRGIFLAVSGMLVLHLLTDVGNFIVPYMTGLHDSLYFEQLGPSHDPVFSVIGLLIPGSQSLLGHDLLAVGSAGSAISLVYVYSLNFIAIVLLLATPAALWYLMFSKKEYEIPAYVPALYLSSYACFLLAPVFSMRRIDSLHLVGVDIITQGLLDSVKISVTTVAAVSLILGFVTLLLCFSNLLKKGIIYFSVISSMIFFAYYIYLFFLDVNIYYIRVVAENMRNLEILLGLYFVIFFLITVLFYIGGFIAFIYELVES
ncbi:hypothetical protein JXB31_01060 [Candidatus Woesearchaeota archaeon]|nr:hypothetical protein [Candidatus Woesearchaeota archaeon]